MACLPGEPPELGIGPDCAQPPPDRLCLHYGLNPTNAPASLSVVLRNAGDGPLRIYDAVVEGSPAYRVAEPPPRDLPPGGRVDVTVLYEGRTPGGDLGLLHVYSDDLAQPTLDVCLRGESGHAPVAEAGADRYVEPLEQVELDGSASYDPDSDGPLTYTWRFAPDRARGGRPEGSTSELLVDESAPHRAQLYADLAGTYHVELIVIDDTGLRNVRREIVEVQAVPSQDLHIQLVWDNPQSDLDLHLARGEGAPFTSDDCYFVNCTAANRGAFDYPSWCDNDDPATHPSLDIDDVDGFGPENINIATPCADRYRIYVHYWSSHDRPDAESPATVRVYCMGALRAETRRVLERDHQLWAVADVLWPPCDVHIIDRMLVQNPPAHGGL